MMEAPEFNPGISGQDQLRQSFARIVAPSATPPPMSLPARFPPYLPYTTSFSTSRGQSYLDERSQNTQFSDVPAQEMESIRNNHFIRNTSQDEKSLLDSYNPGPVIGQQICEVCARCPTCAPQRVNYAGSNFRRGSVPSTGLSSNAAYDLSSNSSGTEKMAERFISEPVEQITKTVNRLNISSKNVPKEQYRSHEADLEPTLNQEYEKWKTRHGISMGRSMKRGLSRLQNATKM